MATFKERKAEWLKEHENDSSDTQKSFAERKAEWLAEHGESNEEQTTNSDGNTVASSASMEEPQYYSFDSKAFGNDIMSLGVELADREMELRPYLERYGAVTTQMSEVDARLSDIKANADALYAQYIASPTDEVYAQYQASAQAYNDLASQYNNLYEQARTLETEYAPRYNAYNESLNAYNSKVSEYDKWKSTVRDKAAIKAEMADIRKQMNKSASAANAMENTDPFSAYAPNGEEKNKELSTLETKYKLLQEELDYADSFKRDAAFKKYGETDTDALETLLEEEKKKKKAAIQAYGKADADTSAEDSEIEDLNSVLEYKKAQKYDALKDEDDYDLRSLYTSTQKDSFKGELVDEYGNWQDINKLFGDVKYDYINGNEDAIRALEQEDTATFRKLIGDEAEFLKTMSREEVANYNYLYSKDKNEAEKYLDFIQSDLYKRYREQLEGQARLSARENPFAASAESVFKNPLKAISYANQIKGFLSDEEIDPNDPAYKWSYTNTAVRDEVSKNFGEVGTFLYQTGMSMADFIYNAAITGGLGGEALLGKAGAKVAQNLTLAIMGTEAAADTVQELKDRGLSDDQAFLVGTINGLVEVITEKISLETLMDKSAWLKNGTVNYLLKNTIAEGSEEAAADILDTIADVVFLGHDSEWNSNIESYMRDGMSYKDAYAQVAKDFVNETFTDALGGALSGFAMAGGGTAVNYASMLNPGARKWYSFVGKYTKAANSSQIETLANMVMDKTDGASPVNQYAVNVLDDIREGKELNDFEVGVIKETAEWFAEHGEKGFEDLDKTLSEKARLSKDERDSRVKELEANGGDALDINATKAGLDINSETYKRLKAEIKAIQSVHKNLEVRFLDSEQNMDGFHDANLIAINTNTKNPLAQVFAHEFTHHLEETAPDAYSKIRETVVNYLKSTFDYDEYLNEVEKLYKGVIKADTEEEYTAKVESEIVAKYIERNVFTNPKSLDSLTHNRGLLETVKDRIGDFASGIKGESMVKDVANSVMNEVEQVLAKEQGREVKQSKRQQKRAEKVKAETKKGAEEYDTQKKEEKKQKESKRRELIDERSQLDDDLAHGLITESEYESRYDEITQELEDLGVDTLKETREQIAKDTNGALEEEETTGYKYSKTSIDTDKENHTAKENKLIEDYLKSIDPKLYEFVMRYVENKNAPFARHTISAVSTRQAELLENLTGEDYSEYTNAINKNGVNHIEAKHGADGRSDKTMRNAEDVARIGYVLENPDGAEIALTDDGEVDWSKEFRTQDGEPAPIIRFYKKIDGTYYVVEAVTQNKYKKLWVVSAYMNKKKGSFTEASYADHSTSIRTSETSAPSWESLDSNIADESESVKMSISEDEDVQDKINHSMTMEEASRMVESAWRLVRDWYDDGSIKNAKQWIEEEGLDAVAMQVENDFNLQHKYVNSNEDILNEVYSLEDVLEAWQNGTLVGKEKKKATRIDTSAPGISDDERFYSPKNVRATREDWDIANQRVTKSNKDAVMNARRNILFAAHNNETLDILGITASELNKKLKSWSNYSVQARNISDRINAGVSAENQWTGIPNSSFLSSATVTDENILENVRGIEGSSRDYERNYIGRTMLALDTHIDWSGILFKFVRQVDSNRSTVRGMFNSLDNVILVGANGSFNTVAHEMGHALDAIWAKDLWGRGRGEHLSDTSLRRDLIKSDLGRQFYDNFRLFIDSLTDVGTNYNAYYQERTETFARFVARFVEWTNEIAGVHVFHENQYYNDRFTQAQFVEFARLLQEKAAYDAEQAGVQYSISEDSDGNKLTEEQIEYFKDSKARDEQGRLLVLYHGTSSAGFTVFEKGKNGYGAWLTTSRRDADSYGGNWQNKLFEPGEEPYRETVTAGNYNLGDINPLLSDYRFDTEEDRQNFIASHPGIENLVDEYTLDELRRDYVKYELAHSYVSTWNDVIENPDRYTVGDLKKALLAWDSEVDVTGDLTKEELLDVMRSEVENYDESRGISFNARIPAGETGEYYIGTNNRTYKLYANLINPKVIDAHGDGINERGRGYYAQIDAAMQGDEFDGIIIRNVRVGRYGDNGDVVLVKNPNQVKLTTNENPTENPDIRYSISKEQDTAYINAVNDGDMETAQRMVDEAAHVAGYDAKVYHGSDQFGFTTLDTKYSDDKISFFTSASPDIAATYTMYGKPRDINSEISYDDELDMMEAASEKLDDAIDDFRRIIDRTFSEWVFGQTDNSYLRKLVDEANPEAGFGDGVYDALTDIVADAFFDYKDQFEEYEDFADFQEHSEEWEAIEKSIIDVETAKYNVAKLDGNIVGGIYTMYANTDNLYVADAKGSLWNNLKLEGVDLHDNLAYNTRRIAKWAKDKGYGGVLFKNIRDNGKYGRSGIGDVYVFFNPQQQLKSADPVTYDNSGNVIPLSDRFNTENNDIRYSISDDEAPIAQAISSWKTSIKQVPALFTNPNVKFGDVNIDIGGGRFDLATQYLRERGTLNLVFDPYNRSAEENRETLQYLMNGDKADTATCANVLNVIAEPAARANVILEAAKSIWDDGRAYFMVYEGDGSGVGKETSAGWQNNRKTADYVSEIEQYFDNVKRNGKLITATNPKKNLPMAAWETEPGVATRYSFTDNEDLPEDIRTLYDNMRFDRQNLPKNAVPYVRRGITQLAEKLTSALDLPGEGRAIAYKYANQLAEQYLRTGTITEEQIDTVFDSLYDANVQEDKTVYNEYKWLRDRLRTTAVAISEQDKSNLDWKNIRERAKGRVKIRKDGTPVDVAYISLYENEPLLFGDENGQPIINASEQLKKMVSVAESLWEKPEQTLEERMESGHRQWAYDEYTAAVRKFESELKSARRFVQVEEATRGGTIFDAYGQEFPKTNKPQERIEITNAEEAAQAYKDIRVAQREYDKAKRLYPLTEDEKEVLHAILMGQYELEHVNPNKYNVRAIKQNLDASRSFYMLDKALKEWKKSRRAIRLEEAAKYEDEFIHFKDKKLPLAYGREIMERNIEDIAPNKEIADDLKKTYFKPIHDHEAERTRFINKYNDRIKSLDLSTKEKRGETMSEAAAVQFLGEAEDNLRILEQKRSIAQKRGRAFDPETKRGGHTIEEWQELIKQMWKDNPSLDEGKIRNAIIVFHNVYDELFELANKVYVENGYAPINYRSGYFPHFNTGEGEGFVERIAKQLGVNTDVTELPTAINGLTHTFKPGVTWFGNKMERKGYETEYNALLGFDKYIRGISDVIYHTDDIQKLRALAYQIRYASTDEAIREKANAINADTNISEEERYARIEELFKDAPYALSNFVKELDEYTNILANKKSKYDRQIEDLLGRGVYNALKWLDSNVGSNMVGGNLSTAFTNFIPLTQLHGYVSAKTILNAGLETMRNAKGDVDGFADRSTFLTNRFGADTLYKTGIQKAGEFASMPMEIIDTFTANVVVRSLYNDAIDRGLSEEDAMDYADEKAARIMAGRSKGDMPTIFAATNPLFKMATKFQLEVNNQFSDAFKDLPKSKRDEGLGKVALSIFNYWLSAWLFNELYEALMGRRAAWDIVNVINNLVGDVTGKKLPNMFDYIAGYDDFDTEQKGIDKAVLNAASDVIEDAPFSSLWGTIGQMAGSDFLSDAGGRIPISSAVPDVSKTIKALNGEYGENKARKILFEELAVPIMYTIMPFGVNQAQKAIKAADALSKGGSYSYDKEDNPLLQYPVNTENPLNWMRLMLFGKNADPYARKWVESNFDTMTKKETQKYENLVNKGFDPYEAYDYIMLPK